MSESDFIPLGASAPVGFIAESNRHQVDGENPWDPEAWERAGWQRNWGDAAVMSPHFEVLRRVDARGAVEFVVLCPTFLRRPLTFSFGQAWGSY